MRTTPLEFVRATLVTGHNSDDKVPRLVLETIVSAKKLAGLFIARVSSIEYRDDSSALVYAFASQIRDQCATRRGSLA
jgi:hypothetical protein